MTVSWPTYGLVAAGVLYFVGGRSAVAARRWRGAAFYAGLLTLLVAIDSPVDTYADRRFWVHMTQHVLLMMVAPPLLLLGRPWPRLIRPFPRSVRLPVARSVLAGSTLAPVRTAGRFVASPLPAFVAFNATLLAWHVPALYDLTIRNSTVHELEHALFFGTALLLWTHLLPGSRTLSPGARVAYGTAALLVSWVLAIVLGLATHPLYGAYPSLTDQQLAAGIMWVPGSIPFCVALFVAAYRWLDPAAGTRRRRMPLDLRPKET
jgi:cytochrome c oxidase assembly factor CtaG